MIELYHVRCGDTKRAPTREERLKRTLALCAWLGVSALAAGGCASFHELTDADLTDPGIKARIIHRLKGEEKIDVSKVEFDVHFGVLTMSGLVASYEDRDRIISIARRARGVRQIVANLIVQQ